MIFNLVQLIIILFLSGYCWSLRKKVGEMSFQRESSLPIHTLTKDMTLESLNVEVDTDRDRLIYTEDDGEEEVGEDWIF